MTDLTKLRLRNFPKPFKALALGYLSALSLAYVYGLANIALVVGLSPRDIAIHYYGAAEKIKVEKAAGEEALVLDQVGEQQVQVPQPSLKNIVTEGHFHLFGMSSFFFGLALLGLFTGIPEKWKMVMVGLPFIVIIVDNLSFLRGCGVLSSSKFFIRKRSNHEIDFLGRCVYGVLCNSGRIRKFAGLFENGTQGYGPTFTRNLHVE
jgi:hypothetical protein